MSHLITIAGLGPGAPEALPLGVWEELRHAPTVLMRTGRYPVVEWLKDQGVTFSTFDEVYERESTFEAVYGHISRAVLDAAVAGPVLYAVPGHPLVGEDASRLIMDEASRRGIPVRVLPASSFLDALYARLSLDPARGLQVVDALAPARLPDPSQPCIVMQVHNRLVASDLKLWLMELYPEEFTVTVIRGAGVAGEERVEYVPLFELDRLPWIDYLTSVYIPPAPAVYTFDSLVEIMARLRADDGCPWDREQDHSTLKRYLIEEAYEVIEAINDGNMHSLCEELGDLLLQVVFNAQVARENGDFNIKDVVAAICDKMVYRHPHVFGKTSVSDADEVLRNWERIKRREKKDRPSLLSGIPRELPALTRAEQVQSRVSRVGFDWPDHEGAMEKVVEEQRELQTAMLDEDQAKIAEELGDLLFSLVNVARLRKIDPEDALRGTVDRFARRFGYIEDKARANGLEMGKIPLSTMDAWWEEAKSLEKKEENFARMQENQG